MAPYKALYSRSCRSLICWDEVGKRKIISLNLVKEIIKKAPMILRKKIYKLNKINKEVMHTTGGNSIFLR